MGNSNPGEKASPVVEVGIGGQASVLARQNRRLKWGGEKEERGADKGGVPV